MTLQDWAAMTELEQAAVLYVKARNENELVGWWLADHRDRAKRGMRHDDIGHIEAARKASSLKQRRAWCRLSALTMRVAVPEEDNG